MVVGWRVKKEGVSYGCALFFYSKIVVQSKGRIRHTAVC